MLQAGRSRDRVPMRWIFSNLPNPSGRTIGPGVDTATNRNEYQESFFFNFHSGGWNQGPLDTAAT
jgi:acetyl esterase/lipase